jgi:hypothetical protein
VQKHAGCDLQQQSMVRQDCCHHATMQSLQVHEPCFLHQELSITRLNLQLKFNCLFIFLQPCSMQVHATAQSTVHHSMHSAIAFNSFVHMHKTAATATDSQKLDMLCRHLLQLMQQGSPC